MLYNEYLLPVIDRLPASKVVRKALNSEFVLLLIHEHLHELTRVFCKYAETEFDTNDLDYCRESGMMNLQQFILLVTDYGFVGGTTTKGKKVGKGVTAMDNNDEEVDDEDGGSSINNDITLKDARQVFSASQHDTAINDVENTLLEEDDHKETMVFPEYIEAIVRLGFVKYSLPGESHDKDNYECVQRVMNKMISKHDSAL